MLRLGFLQNEPPEKLKDRWCDLHRKMRESHFILSNHSDEVDEYYEDYGYSRIHELETLIGIFSSSNEYFLRDEFGSRFFPLARAFHESDLSWKFLTRAKGDISDIYSSIILLETKENVEDYLYARDLSGVSIDFDFWPLDSKSKFFEHLKSRDSRVYSHEFSEVLRDIFYLRRTIPSVGFRESFTRQVTESAVVSYLTFIHGQSKMIEFMKKATSEGYSGRAKDIHNIVSHWEEVSELPLYMAQFVAEDLALQNDATELNLGDYDSPWKALL